MRILSGALITGAVCLSILTGCSGSEGSGDKASEGKNGSSGSQLEEFEGTWENKDSGAKLKIADSGKATLAGWEDKDDLSGKLNADNTDGVASFDATGEDTPFHFLVEFRNDEADRVYLDETNESDVPPLVFMKQG